jgi:predicted RNase H-like nuclease
MLAALERGGGRLGLRLSLSPVQREALVDDAGGDLLDAVLCLMLAAWAQPRPAHGVPVGTDVVEGWIVGPW